MTRSTDASNRRPAWLLPAVALVLVAGIVWAWPGTEAPQSPPIGAFEVAGTAGQAPTGAPTRPESGSLAAERSDLVNVRSTAARNDSCAQGLRGLVVDAGNRPVADVDVHLVESASNDPLLLPQLEHQQHFLAPLATDRTDVDGSFALGLEVVQDKIYEVYVVSPRHAIARLSGLRLLAETWHDLGAITLDSGAMVRGRVTVAGRPDLPVPQAVVSIESGGAFADAAMRALPGGSAALVAHVDAGGFYELPRAPRRGVVRVSALAPGFARVTKRDIEITPAGTTQVDFELPPGQSLSGDVRDPDGNAIVGARIEAWPKQSSVDALVAFSDEQGAFVLHGMRNGPHRVRAVASGHETMRQDSVLPDQDLHLVLARRSGVQVIARTPNGVVLRRYRLGLRRFFPTDSEAPLDDAAVRTGKIGTVTEVPEQHVRLDAGARSAEITGIPAGLFVCEVAADGYAKTLSVPITCKPGEEPTPSTIEVIVTRGVRLRGLVTDAAGNPLAAATVTTQSNGLMPDSPLFRLLQSAVPRKISQRTVRTGADGWFTLDRLALADYQLQIEHPDGCRTFVRDLRLDTPGARTLPAIRLNGGAIVRGSATFDGRVVGQMKVILTTTASTPASASVRLETITDAEGRFRFTRRVPPGDYQLRCAVVGATAPDAEIFQQLLQLKRSSTNFSVAPGQGVVERDLDLPSAN